MNVRLGVLGAAAMVLAAWPAATTFAVGDSSETDYPPPEYCTIAAKTATVKAGDRAAVTVSAKPKVKVDVTVTSKSATVAKDAKTTGDDGTASFSFALKSAGDYTVSAATDDGKVCALSVVAEKQPTAVAPFTDSESGSELAFTGANTVPYLAAAAVLAGGGVAMIALARRRRQS